MFDLEASTLTPFIRCTEMGDALPGGVFFIIYWLDRGRTSIPLMKNYYLEGSCRTLCRPCTIAPSRPERRRSRSSAERRQHPAEQFFFIYIFYCLLRQPLFVVGTQLKSFFLYFCFSKQPLFAVEERYKRTWTYLGTLTPTTSSPGLGGWGRQRSGQRQRNINLDFNCQERNVGTILCQACDQNDDIDAQQDQQLMSLRLCHMSE